PGDVVDEKDPHEPAPDVAAQCALECEAVQDPSGRGRDQEREQHEHREASCDPAHAPILVELTRVSLPVRLALGFEQPSGMRVPEPAKTSAMTDVRAVGIALL